MNDNSFYLTYTMYILFVNILFYLLLFYFYALISVFFKLTDRLRTVLMFSSACVVRKQKCSHSMFTLTLPYLPKIIYWISTDFFILPPSLGNVHELCKYKRPLVMLSFSFFFSENSLNIPILWFTEENLVKKTGVSSTLNAPISLQSKHFDGKTDNEIEERWKPKIPNLSKPIYSWGTKSLVIYFLHRNGLAIRNY